MLCFGLLRPYKGIDVLVEAWQGIEDAELWIVGAPRMDTAPLRAAAPPGVRFVERFVSEGEAAALFRRADLAVLPYREIEQSGVLFTALGFGVPLVLTDVGGFPDIAAAGAAELVAAGRRGRAARRPREPARRPRAPRHPGDGRAAPGRRGAQLGRDRARAPRALRHAAA